jgi:hypothetical protein
MSRNRDGDRDRDQQGKAKSEQRVELKYCEGCGGLGVRECGGGQVYCNDCAGKLAEMAGTKKTSRRPTLPVGKRSQLDDCAGPNGPDLDDTDINDLDAMGWTAGGAA